MKRSETPVEKVTMNLFTGDAEKLRDAFPRQGASFIVRNLVRSFIRKVEEDASRKNSPMNIAFDIKETE